MADIDVTPGQIWSERHVQGRRLVKVLESPRDWVRIRSCDQNGEIIKGSRRSLINPGIFQKRFMLFNETSSH